jgi:hypothetical protein
VGYCASIAAMMLLLSLAVNAQSGDQGEIGGTLTDPSGSAVAGAQVEVLHIGTGKHFTGVSNDEGIYRLFFLPVGIYKLRAEQKDFAPIQMPRIEVGAGAQINLPLKFHPVRLSLSVTVVDKPPMIETSRSQQSAILDSRSISSLPVNGRDFAFFSLLTPGVNADARGGLSFGGQRAMNSLLVDGINNDSAFWGQPKSGFDLNQFSQADYHISLEAIQEFQVNANAYSAELGRAGGGVINAVTKSGTNAFHGSAFWFYRDKSLNANSTINKSSGLPKSPYHFNQAGGTASGPILRNRLFFFAGYDALRSELVNPVILNLPPGFQFDPDQAIARFQRSAFNYLDARAFSWHLPYSQDDYLVKIDWLAAEHHRLNVHWNRQDLLAGLQAGNPQTSYERADQTPETAQAIGGTLTSIFGSKAHQVRVAYARDSAPWNPLSINPEAKVFEGGQLVLQVGRAPGRPQKVDTHAFQLVDMLSLQHGRHEWKFGADVSVGNITFLNAQNFTGSYRFQSLESFGRSLEGFPVPQSGEYFRQAFSDTGTPGSITHPDTQQYSGYAEDSWRVRSNIMLHLGLRYDLQEMARPPVKNASLELAAAGIDTILIRKDRNNFAPRVGLAWSLGGGQRVVVRLGYGIFYAPTPSVLAARAHFHNGISVQLRTFYADDPSTRAFIPIYPNSFCGPPDPGGSPPSCPPPSVGGAPPVLMAFSPTFRQPYVQQGSIGIEGEVAKALTISASYLVFKGTHLQRVRDVNLATAATSTIGIANSNAVLTFHRFPQQRPMPEFNRVLLIESAADSIYHGLAVQVRKAYAHGIQITGSYTLSKVIDDNPNVYAINPGVTDSWLVADPSNPGADRAAGDNDQRHRLTLSFILEPHIFKALPNFEKIVLGGWQLSGIIAAQSGMPYSGLVAFDLNNDGNADAERTPGYGRNLYPKPSIVSFALRITRSIPFSSGLHLLIAWEGFNVFNRGNIYDVNRIQNAYETSPSACGIAAMPCLGPLPSFGTPTVAAGPRIMQLSARLVF